MLYPSLISSNPACPPPWDKTLRFIIQPSTDYLPSDSPEYPPSDDCISSPDHIAHHIYSRCSFLIAFSSFLLVLPFFFKRCYLVKLPNIFNLQSELIISPGCSFLHCFLQFRYISIDCKIIRIAYNRIHEPISFSPSYLNLSIDISQHIGHDIIEYPCRKVTTNAKMIPRIIAHKSTQES